MVNNENTTINTKNNAFDAFNDHRWFQYAVTVALNHKNFGKKNSQIISKLNLSLTNTTWKK